MSSSHYRSRVIVRRGAKINQVKGGSRNTIKPYLVQDGTDQAVENTNKHALTLSVELAKNKEGGLEVKQWLMRHKRVKAPSPHKLRET